MPTKSKVSKVSKVRRVKKVREGKGQAFRQNAFQAEAFANKSAFPRPGLGKAKVTRVSKTAEKSAGKKSTAPTKKTVGPVAEVFNVSGKKEGRVALSREIFGAKVNKKLLAQALHIYFVNSSAHYASTKTRSQVRGGGVKPWRQKGTGRARAGSRRSPLWVGGAKALGPKPRKTVLTLPKKMKSLSLISALSAKAQDGKVKVVSSFEKIQPKTKIVANFLNKTAQKGSTLFIISAKNDNVTLATRNLQKVLLDTATNLNAHEIIKNQNLIFTKEALEIIGNRFPNKRVLEVKRK